VCSRRQIPTRRLNQSAPEILSISSEGSTAMRVATPPQRGLAPRIDERSAHQTIDLSSTSAHFRECMLRPVPFVACRTIISFAKTEGVAMQNGARTNMRTRQTRPAAPFGPRPKRWTSNAARPESQGSHNARRNYERYLALAQAEAQAGNLIGAENYYQHAEHYYRSMSSAPTTT
jgi:Domain of unknown function (DUF4167)